MIYFIGAGDLRVVKVGYATEPERRVRNLQVGQPFDLQLLGAIPGTREQELAAHEVLRRFYRRGEWFERAPALQFMAECQALGTEGAITQWRSREAEIDSERERQQELRRKLFDEALAQIVARLVVLHGVAAVVRAAGVSPQTVRLWRHGTQMSPRRLFMLTALDAHCLDPLFAIWGLKTGTLIGSREVRG